MSLRPLVTLVTDRIESTVRAYLPRVLSASPEAARLRKVGACILFGISLLILGYQLFIGGNPIDQVPDRADLRVPWACHSCGKVLELTPRERVKLEQKASDFAIGGKPATDDEAGEEGRTSFRELILPCLDCGKMELRRAPTCPKCKKAFASVLKDQVQKCPGCGWDSAAPPTSTTQPQPSRRRP